MSAPVQTQVQHTHSLTGEGDAIAQITDASGHVSIHIPAGRGGILTSIDLAMEFIGEDVVNSGGIVQLRNSDSDWYPFYVPTGCWTVDTEGGSSLAPMSYPCFKKLPGNSTVTVNYMPLDDQSQYLQVTLHWILTNADPATETFYDVIHPLLGDAHSKVARHQVDTSWEHNGATDMIPIPKGKEGYTKYVIFQPWGTTETILVGGGEIEMENDAYDITPSEFYTTMISEVTASGAGYNPMLIKHHVECKADSNFRFFSTFRDNQAQVTTCGICWETAYKAKP